MVKKRGLIVPQKREQGIFIKSFLQGVNTKIDPTVVGVNSANSMYNFKFDSGVLKNGNGLRSSELLDKRFNGYGISTVWLYQKREPNKASYLMIVLDIGVVYYKNLDDGLDVAFKQLIGLQFKTTPKAINYRLYGEDVVIMTSSTDGMWVWNGDSKLPQKIENAPNITSLTLHGERLFITTPDSPDSVWFSEDLDPTNFSLELKEGGFIDMIDSRGMPKSLLSYQNFVYIFREYGITRLSANGGQEDFALSHLFVSSGKINPSTVCLCGDIIMFLASDGLYAFDGISVNRVLDSVVSELIATSNNACGEYFQGKYYLALRLDFKDGDEIGCESAEYKNNALLEFDINNGNHSISRGLDIVELVAMPVYGQILAITNDGCCGMIVDNGSAWESVLPKKWSVGPTDFNEPDKIKTIKAVYLLTRSNLVLQIKNENSHKDIVIKGSRHRQLICMQKININMTGVMWSVSIKSVDSTVYVSRLKFVVEHK